MGIFKEDSEIRLSELIKLWVAEGFLKPIDGKSMEDVAEKYLNELIDINLVLVHKLGSTGSIKYCKVHDLLRDLCLREAQKQDSLNLQSVNTQRRIAILDNASQEKVLDALQSVSLARSLTCNIKDVTGPLPAIKCRLLRVLSTFNRYSHGGQCLPENILQLVNSRYLAITAYSGSKFASSVGLLWNLHTLIIHQYSGSALFEIWELSQLRHVKVYKLSLPDPPSGRDDIVLKNLQTLRKVLNFKCSEEVVKRIPNLKKLDVEYTLSDNYGLVNLDRQNNHILSLLLFCDVWSCAEHYVPTYTHEVDFGNQLSPILGRSFGKSKSAAAS